MVRRRRSIQACEKVFGFLDIDNQADLSPGCPDLYMAIGVACLLTNLYNSTKMLKEHR
jgi:hypothetical protein